MKKLLALLRCRFSFRFFSCYCRSSFNADKRDINLEQAFGRYSLNRDFNISFGRQLTVLGYESDEATVGLHTCEFQEAYSACWSSIASP